MSDRELLELAAKAAGYANAKYQDLRGWGEVRYGLAEAIWTGEGYWNPITDDGDALRLAVKLAVDFKIRNGVTWWDHQESDGVVSWGHELHNNDPLAATRRAITRAAAEIGRQMP